MIRMGSKDPAEPVVSEKRLSNFPITSVLGRSSVRIHRRPGIAIVPFERTSGIGEFG